MSYPIPESTLETRLEVKKSVFHACAGYAPDRDAAMNLLAECKGRYPDARHHCWAYVTGHPLSATSAAMSDDGEPAGTAGKPIFNVLQHKGVGDVMVVVSRYFGGVKLGSGGLVRAYSAATQQTMQQLPTVQQVQLTNCTLRCDFKHEQYLRLWTEQHHGHIRQCEYGAQVTMHLALPQQAVTQLDGLLASLNDAVRIRE
ncbi:MAG: YigZ family protein [Pseudomonadota bacterium]|nr:YigZ family protein [Pseudomonadota bacterium]